MHPNGCPDAYEGVMTWIEDLRGRLERGELADLLPSDLGDGALATGELTVRVMLADLDHLDWLADHGFETASLPTRRRGLMADFDRLHALIG